MKTCAWFCVLMSISFSSGTVRAGDGESGLFVGVGVNILSMDGTGSWADKDFSLDAPLSTESGQLIGLNWSDKLMFGAKPVAGYRFNPSLALQANYSYFVPKTASQSYTVTTQNYVYRQSMDLEWSQQGVELLALVHPMEQKNIFLLGGVEFVGIEAKVTFSEGVEYDQGDGILGNASDSQSTSDKISAFGYVVGGGLESPPGDSNFSTFILVQYSTAVTKDSFFGTEDFRVKVGGFSVMLGAKWTLFD